MSEFRFGDKVLARVELKRRYADGRKKWVTEPIADYDAWQHCTREREGVVIGKRTLANGTISWGDWEEPTSFRAEERFTAYLVAHDMRRKPFLVLAEDLVGIEVAA